MIDVPSIPGWHLLGAFADGDYNPVGSWLLHNKGEAMLLELPPGDLTVDLVRVGLDRISAELRFVTASHSHFDHLDPELWNALIDAFPDVQFLSPDELEGDTYIELAGEPAWLIKAPKHSPDDVVTVFRGVAMTGDIETGKLDSEAAEVSLKQRRASMDYLRGFQDRAGYHVHTQFSAHLTTFRTNIDWRAMFTYADRPIRKKLPPKQLPPPPKRTQCRSYGCWGKLVPILAGELQPSGERYYAGFDVKCEKCGAGDWSNPRVK